MNMALILVEMASVGEVVVLRRRWVHLGGACSSRREGCGLELARVLPHLSLRFLWQFDFVLSSWAIFVKCGWLADYLHLSGFLCALSGLPHWSRSGCRASKACLGSVMRIS